jgi:hypothetical protein
MSRKVFQWADQKTIVEWDFPETTLFLLEMTGKLGAQTSPLARK